MALELMKSALDLLRSANEPNAAEHLERAIGSFDIDAADGKAMSPDPG